MKQVSSCKFCVVEENVDYCLIVGWMVSQLVKWENVVTSERQKCNMQQGTGFQGYFSVLLGALWQCVFSEKNPNSVCSGFFHIQFYCLFLYSFIPASLKGVL